MFLFFDHEIKLFGKYIPVKAKIEHLESLYAHADLLELSDWLGEIKIDSEKVFLIHGEPLALDAFRVKIKDAFGWPVHVPKLYETLKIPIS